MPTVTQVKFKTDSSSTGEIFLGDNTHIKKEANGNMLLLTGGTSVVKIDSYNEFTFNDHRIFHEGNTTVSTVEPTASDGNDGDFWWVIE